MLVLWVSLLWLCIARRNTGHWSRWITSGARASDWRSRWAARPRPTTIPDWGWRWGVKDALCRSPPSVTASWTVDPILPWGPGASDLQTNNLIIWTTYCPLSRMWLPKQIVWCQMEWAFIVSLLAMFIDHRKKTKSDPPRRKWNVNLHIIVEWKVWNENKSFCINLSLCPPITFIFCPSVFFFCLPNKMTLFCHAPSMSVRGIQLAG